MDFSEAYLMCKLGHPKLAGWWGKVLGGGSGGGGSGGGGGGSDDDGGSKPFDQLTWDQVIASTKTGKYKSFAVGDMKELDLGTEGIVHMQIVGIDADELADGSGYAPLTFISKELLKANHRMNPQYVSGQEGTGMLGGWEKCEMRAYFQETIKPLIPESVRNAIKSVTKYSNSFDTSDTKVLNSITTDDVWIPSRREIFGDTAFETLGVRYSTAFASNNDRKKLKVGASSAIVWALRSAYSTHRIAYVAAGGGGGVNGMNNNDLAQTSNAIPLGFCL